MTEESGVVSFAFGFFFFSGGADAPGIEPASPESESDVLTSAPHRRVEHEWGILIPFLGWLEARNYHYMNSNWCLQS